MNHQYIQQLEYDISYYTDKVISLARDYLGNENVTDYFDAVECIESDEMENGYSADEHNYIDTFENRTDTLKEVRIKLDKIEKVIAEIEKTVSIKYIDTSKKSISTYLTVEMSKSNLETIANSNVHITNNYYKDLEDEELEEFENITIRISDHNIGQYFNNDTGESSSYDNENINIVI